MSLLSRHVSQLQSEEFVLGVSHGFRGETGTRMEGIESTKLSIVAAPSSKNWSGFVSIDQTISDSKVGEALKNKAFPARCLLTYRRVTASESKNYDGRVVEKDVEKLVVTGVEYICQVDLVDVKVQKTEQK